MILLNSNVDYSGSSFVPWQIGNGLIQKGMIQLPFDGLKVKPQELTKDTKGFNEAISNESLFIEYEGTNLQPTIVPSKSDLTYALVLVSRQLSDTERVVFVKPNGAYLLEWNYNSLSRQFDAIIAFRSSAKPMSLSIFIANEKDEVSELIFSREQKGKEFSMFVKQTAYQKQSVIRTDKPLSILPYRPYIVTKYIFVHRANKEAAMKIFGTEKYEYIEYQNLKSLRKQAAVLKQQGIKVATLFYNEDELNTLSEDQKFFTRALAEYFSFVNISYKGAQYSRYRFGGKTTIPRRKQTGRKPNAKKPGKKTTSDGKKPFNPKGKSDRKPTSGKPMNPKGKFERKPAGTKPNKPTTSKGKRQ